MSFHSTPRTTFLLLILVTVGILAVHPPAIGIEGLELPALAAGFLLASLIIAVWAGRRTKNRLAHLAAVAESITDGDFSARAEVSGKDFLSSVSASLNRMAEHVQTSVEQLKAGEERIREIAYHDPLTGLPNRRLFHELFNRELSVSRRYEYELALVVLDVDHLKDVNDSLGHLAGDLLLAEMGARIKRQLRSSDVIARLAGDEFVLLMRTGGRPDDILATVERVLRSCQEPVAVDTREIQSSMSAGVCFFPQDGEDALSLFRNADFALYQSKKEGRNKILRFNRSMNALAKERLEIEQEIRLGLKQDQFKLFWQPQVSLVDGRIVGLEGLVRWHHPTRGLVGPGSFIQTAEDTGLMPDLGYRVLLEACRRAAHWRDRGYARVPVSVNVSVRQLQAGDFADIVERVLLLTDLESGLLKLELTESMAAEGEGMLPHLSRLRSLGVGLAIDDFGTGYSSFSYLLKHRIDTIKIDRSFVSGLPTNRDSVGVVKAILSMAQALELEVVAEGVETQAQLDFLAGCGCEVVQGFLLQEPIPWRELEALLVDGKLPIATPSDGSRRLRLLKSKDEA